MKVVRGIKGLWWNPSAYPDFVNFLAENQLNYFMLCYTAFPESSSLWRHPYSKKATDCIKTLNDMCNHQGIELNVAINPGISCQHWFNELWKKYGAFRGERISITSPDPPIRCTSSADMVLLWSKVRHLYNLGVRSFTLALDDIAEEIWSSADFTAMAHDHANLLSSLNKSLLQLGRDNMLYYVPLTYNNKHVREHPEYLELVSEDLPENINVFWTGEEVVSTTFTRTQVATFRNLIGRKPIFWLNYPVNADSHLAGKLQMEPLKFDCRDPWKNIAGLVVNPMLQPESSKIVVATISDYMRDPHGYTPKKALDKALRSSYSKDITSQLRYFIRLYSRSGYTKCTPERIGRGELTSEEIAHLTDAKDKLKTMIPRLTHNLRPLNPTLAEELITAYKRLALFTDTYKSVR